MQIWRPFVAFGALHIFIFKQYDAIDDEDVQKIFFRYFELKISKNLPFRFRSLSLLFR